MLIGLFTFITVVLMGGDTGPFVVPKVEKHIVSSISDKQKQKEFKALSKSFVREWKTKNKSAKKRNKALTAMIKDRAVSTAQLSEELTVAISVLLAHNNQLGDLRMQVQEMLTDEEWQHAIDQIQDQKPKKVNKLEKQELKANLKQQEKFQKLREDITSSVPDQATRDQCLEAIDQFEEDLAALLFENQDQANQVIDVMHDGNATRAQIHAITDGFTTIKQTSGESFIKLRSAMIEASDDQAWPKMSKALVKFLE